MPGCDLKDINFDLDLGVKLIPDIAILLKCDVPGYISVRRETVHNVAVYRNTRSLFQNLQEKV